MTLICYIKLDDFAQALVTSVSTLLISPHIALLDRVHGGAAGAAPRLREAPAVGQGTHHAKLVWRVLVPDDVVPECV